MKKKSVRSTHPTYQMHPPDMGMVLGCLVVCLQLLSPVHRQSGGAIRVPKKEYKQGKERTSTRVYLNMY